MVKTGLLWVACLATAPQASAAGPEWGLADRLRLAAAPLRWRELLVPEARVVFVGDTPMRREGKAYLAAIVGDLAQAGITHLALELPAAGQADLDRFCAGHDDGRVREALWEAQGLVSGESALGLLRASCSAGLALVALDADAREDAVAARLAALLEARPEARVLAVLRRDHVATSAQPAALKRRGFESRSYAFLTSGVETEPADRRYYLALEAAGLRTSALLLPCPAGIGAQGCLAVPAVLEER